MSILEQAKSIPHGARVISEWLGDGGRVCDPAEAQARANVCLTCAHNKQGLTITKAVALAIKQHLAVKNRLNLRVDGEKKLGACEVCTCQLRLQVWQPIEMVKAEITETEIPLYPSFCWKIK